MINGTNNQGRVRGSETSRNREGGMGRRSGKKIYGRKEKAAEITC